MSDTQHPSNFGLIFPTPLVALQSARVTTTSLRVAQTFGKEHLHVLRDIRELECSPEFNLLNFEETSYLDSYKRPGCPFLSPSPTLSQTPHPRPGDPPGSSGSCRRWERSGDPFPGSRQFPR